MIHRGKVFQNIDGVTTDDIYRNISKTIPLGAGLTSDNIYKALCDREKMLSTAIGKGVALPHASSPLVKNIAEERISVCYLKSPIEMGAPDGRKVYVMFVLITGSTHSHLKILSEIAQSLRDEGFIKLLEKRANEAELLTSLNKLL